MTKSTQKSIQREKTIQTRVTDQEYEIIESKANFLGLTVSNYLRLIALHVKVDVSIDPIQDKEN